MASWLRNCVMELHFWAEWVFSTAAPVANNLFWRYSKNSLFTMNVLRRLSKPHMSPPSSNIQRFRDMILTRHCIICNCKKGILSTGISARRCETSTPASTATGTVLNRSPAHYVQGQSPQAKVREYFYYIDHQGQLFLDDAKVKNFITCFKGALHAIQGSLT